MHTSMGAVSRKARSTAYWWLMVRNGAGCVVSRMTHGWNRSIGSLSL